MKSIRGPKKKFDEIAVQEFLKGHIQDTVGLRTVAAVAAVRTSHIRTLPSQPAENVVYPSCIYISTTSITKEIYCWHLSQAGE